ncbi:MAG: tyrosine-type recombinase/integrase [Bryobacteraceae bacterium]
MKPLRQAIDDYITLRRTLGFKLHDVANDLRNFAAFLEQKTAPHITTEFAMEWAMLPADHQPSDWAQRLSAVRVFARHWHATDPRTEIPPIGLLPFRPQRARPYLYSELEIQKLLTAALKLPPRQGLRPWTYHCLFGLLAVAGLRISEALKLEQADVDLREGILTIRQTKFGKTRLVPLHSSTREAMGDYAQRRNRFLRSASSACFFLNDHGRRLDGSAVRRTFYDLSRQIGLRGPEDHKGPRLHDFRHRFAVRTLVQWYRSNEDIERRLPVLSAFLGHGHVADTYWYLSVEPELMGLATRRLELRWGLAHEE